MKFTCEGQFLGMDEGEKGYYQVRLLQDEYIVRVSIKDEESIERLKRAQKMDDVILSGCRDFPHVNNGQPWSSYGAKEARLVKEG